MAKNKSEEALDETAEDAGLEPRTYELGFHLDPELPQEEVKKIYQTIRDRIAGVGTVVAEGEPAKIPLAYTISRSDTTGRRDYTTSYFCWIAYEADGSGHDAISALARDAKQIIRFLDIRTTPEAAQHSAEIHELFAKAGVEPLSEAEEAEPIPAPVAEEKE